MTSKGSYHLYVRLVNLWNLLYDNNEATYGVAVAIQAVLQRYHAAIDRENHELQMLEARRNASTEGSGKLLLELWKLKHAVARELKYKEYLYRHGKLFPNPKKPAIIQHIERAEKAAWKRLESARSKEGGKAYDKQG